MSAASAQFRKLYAEHKDTVRSVLLRLAPPAEVDDLVQEVFIKASRTLHQFRGEASTATWLHRIARNTALDHLRSRRHNEVRKTEPLPDSSEQDQQRQPLSEAPKARARVESGEMNGCIREYIERLPADHRQVLELKDLEGLTNPEIAKRLEISVETAKIRLHRARAALRASLSEGCDFYQNERGNLACDRRTSARVSVTQAISSKKTRRKDGASRSASAAPQSTHYKVMSSATSCCAAPAAAASAGSQYTPVAAAFAAIGAAIGANCEPCLRHHVREALKLGISREDVARAVATADHVKATPAQNIIKLAERLTNGTVEEPAGGCGCSAP